MSSTKLSNSIAVKDAPSAMLWSVMSDTTGALFTEFTVKTTESDAVNPSGSAAVNRIVSVPFHSLSLISIIAIRFDIVTVKLDWPVAVHVISLSALSMSSTKSSN
jgi:hypothetical protein